MWSGFALACEPSAHAVCLCVCVSLIFMKQHLHEMHFSVVGRCDSFFTAVIDCTQFPY